MASNSATFGALTELVEPSQIVFGTDYPYMPDMAVKKYLSEIDIYPRFDSKSKSAIVSGNALGLFHRINGKPEGRDDLIKFLAGNCR
jgi:6-methylsalicylate decarboxylase